MAESPNTTSRLTVEEIRKRFPNPVRSTHGEGEGYCVGGALCLTIYTYLEQRSFPVPAFLTETLQKANPLLPYHAAKVIASDIIALNDSGEFDQAWDALNWALSYTREGE